MSWVMALKPKMNDTLAASKSEWQRHDYKVNLNQGKQTPANIASVKDTG